MPGARNICELRRHMSSFGDCLRPCIRCMHLNRHTYRFLGPVPGSVGVVRNQLFLLRHKEDLFLEGCGCAACAQQSPLVTRAACSILSLHNGAVRTPYVSLDITGGGLVPSLDLVGYCHKVTVPLHEPRCAPQMTGKATESSSEAIKTAMDPAAVVSIFKFCFTCRRQRVPHQSVFSILLASIAFILRC